jgi:protein SCO1/2
VMRRFVFAVALLAAVSAFAQEPPKSAAASYFANLSLVDQDGRRIDLYNDLMKGKTVVINSFFASCTGSCPVMGRAFLHAQGELGPRLGSEVNLISITVDPANDTSAALHEYAKKMNAKHGWYFLTGSPAEVEAALKKIGQYTATREDHMNLMVAGNDRTGLWKKVFALAKPKDVYDVILTVANDRGETPAGTH